MSRSVIDLTGQRFNMWTVKDLHNDRSKDGSSRWVCECDCGTTRVVDRRNLVTGRSKCCGCYVSAREVANISQANFVHGMWTSPEYRTWAVMVQQCTNPKHIDFWRYGGSGIEVVPEWEADFENFLTDMGLRPSPMHRLERIDDTQGFSKDNCQWSMTAHKKRKIDYTGTHTIHGENLTLLEIAEKYKVHYFRLRYRVAKRRQAAIDALNELLELKKTYVPETLHPKRPEGS